MTLPLTFLLGIGIVLLHEQLSWTLPGQAGIDTLWPFVALLPIPWLLSRWLGARLRATLRMREQLPRAAEISARLPGLAVPAIYAGIVFGGGLPEFLSRALPRSELLQHVMLLGPLVFMEVSVRLGEARTVRFAERVGIHFGNLIGPSRLPVTFFVLAPILAFSAVTDLLFDDRRLEVFFGGTALGSSLGLLIAVGGLCATLPLFFRWTLPTSTRLPPHVDNDVRLTARQLGFPERRILTLRTGHRMVNAALVGPLPWPRYLVLSDGILTLLDRRSLRGVLAHEIGHAKAKHPGLLLVVFVLIPILLLHPLLTLDWAAVDPAVLTLCGGVAAFLTIWVLRRIAHRFEYEADELSAEALGGIQPCIDALERVGNIYPGHRYRASFRHPSEDQRIAHLTAWANDPHYRRLHRRRGRLLRAGVALAVLLALGASSAVHAELWPMDRAVYLLYSGRFAEARDHLATIHAAPPVIHAGDLEELRLEAEAAIELVGTGGDWTELRGELARRAWVRGVDVLVESGPAAARPWLALALSDEASDPLQRTVYLWADAIVDGETERARVLRDHVFSLGVPERLGDALRAH